MKKIFTLIAVLTFVSFGAKAQTDTLFYENFDVDNTASWPAFNSGNDMTFVNMDLDGLGDANNRPTAWFWTDGGTWGPDSLSTCLLSSSWLSPAGAANNWLIMPPVTITDASALFAWLATPRQAPSYVDGYKVLVSTTDNIEASFTDTIFTAAEMLDNQNAVGKDFSTYVFSPGFVHGEDGTYTSIDTTSTTSDFGLFRPFTASLGGYVGQTIYIAFVHDSFDDNLIAIDNLLVTQAGPTGVAEASKETTIRVYPNPTTDKIQLDYNLPASSDVQVKIFDTKGAVVKEINKGTQSAGTQKMTINVSDLSSGVYSISLIAGKNTTHSTVVVNHN